MGNSHFPGLAVAVGVALLLGGLSVLGCFSLPDGLAYDWVTRLVASQIQSPSHVVLVQSNYDQRLADDQVWSRFLRLVEEMGADQVIFTFVPSKVSAQFYATAAEKGNVFFGLRDETTRGRRGAAPGKPTATQPQTAHIKTGVCTVPPAEYGINRFARAYGIRDGKRYKHLVVEAAEARVGAPIRTGQLYAVNFLDHPTGLPTLDLDMILRGRIVPELIRGKSVVVGFQVPAGFSALQTPLGATRLKFSPVEFHAYALETLLSKRLIRWMGRWSVLLVIFVVLISGVLAQLLLRPLMAGVFACCFIVASVAVACALLRLFLIWIPLTEVVVTEGLVFVSLTVVMSYWKDRHALRILLQETARVRALLVPESFLTSEQHWSQIIAMVNQTLNLTRSIFLERVGQDHRVKEVAAYNTSLSDIEERRRDYRRTPYTTALKEGVPVKVDRFFSSSSPSEEQHLVPLSFGGDILGFWAFGLHTERASDTATLLAGTVPFASQIAEMLYRRQQWRKEHEPRTGWVRYFGPAEATEESFQRIGEVFSLLNRKLALMDSALSALGTATIIYDLFGRVLAINQKMTDLLRSIRLTPYDVTPVDLVSRLSGRESREVRTGISRVVLHGENLHLAAVLGIGRLETSFLLRVGPVRTELESLSQPDYSPFNLHGLFIELREVTDAADLAAIKDQVIRRSSVYLKEGIQSLGNTYEGLESQENLSPALHENHAMLGSQIAALSGAVEEMLSYLGTDTFSNGGECFPLDITESVRMAINAAPEAARKKKVTFDIRTPDTPILALVVPQDLSELLEALVTILVADAYERTRIVLETERKGLQIICSFSNSGYGMPDEDFQRYLLNPSLSGSRAFETLHELVPKLKRWHGGLKGSSKVGEGVRFRLNLVRSMLSP